MDERDLLTLLNSVGFPIVALYAFLKGYVVSPRELRAMEARYAELKARHDRLEEDVRKERAEMRAELAETRAILYRVLMGEVKPVHVNVQTPTGD